VSVVVAIPLTNAVTTVMRRDGRVLLIRRRSNGVGHNVTSFGSRGLPMILPDVRTHKPCAAAYAALRACDLS
jgi:hypothetical protein